MKNYQMLIFCLLLNNLYCFWDESDCGSCNKSECGNPGCEYQISLVTEAVTCWWDGEQSHLDASKTFDSPYCIGINNEFEIIKDKICSHYSNNTGLCVSNGTKCEYKKCEELFDNCTTLNHCVKSGNSCKVNNCQGYITLEDCKNIFLNNSIHFCEWENNRCVEIYPKCGENNNDKSYCVYYNTSEANYICYSDGEKCAEANSCETVRVKNITEEELSNLCSKFPHCQPGKKKYLYNK